MCRRWTRKQKRGNRKEERGIRYADAVRSPLSSRSFLVSRFLVLGVRGEGAGEPGERHRRAARASLQRLHPPLLRRLLQASIVALATEGARPRGRDADWGHAFVQAEFAMRLIYRPKRYLARLAVCCSS